MGLQSPSARLPGASADQKQGTCPFCAKGLRYDSSGELYCLKCASSFTSRRHAARACAMSCRMTDWTVALLPPEEREWCADEFLANLQVMAGEGCTWWRQVRQALSNLRGVWQLRRELGKPRSLPWWRS